MRLRRAVMRDEKVLRIGANKRKDNQPLSTFLHIGKPSSTRAMLIQLPVVRAAFFQNAIRMNDGKEMTLEQIVPLVEEFVHQDDEEYAEVKSQRRAGRASSTREDVLRIKIAKNEKEYENGFCKHTLTPRQEIYAYNIRHARSYSH